MNNSQTIITQVWSKDCPQIAWVDTAKALGLFFVFWGHLLYGGSPIASVINKAIYSFHMPLYFILSGYVIKQDTTRFPDYLKNKFNKILLPALLLYLLTLPIYFIFLDYQATSIKSIICTVPYINGKCAYNSPIWFFFCLFQVHFIVRVLKLSKSSNCKLAIVLIASLILSFVCYTSGWNFCKFFGLNKCLLGLFFLSFGILLKRVKYEKSMKVIGLLASPIWLYTGVILNTKPSMYSMLLGNFWLFILSAITGSFVFFTICKLVDKNNFIQQYAKWTIFIVSSHYVLVTFFTEIALRLSISGTIIFDITSVVFVLIALLAYKLNANSWKTIYQYC